MVIKNNSRAVEILRTIQIQAEERYPHVKVQRFDFQKYKESLKLLTARSSIEISKERKNAAIARAETVNKLLPTQYEDFAVYNLLYSSIPIISDCAEFLEMKLPKCLTIGTTCSGKINAHILIIDEKEEDFLLVVNRQIIVFIDFFSDFLANIIAKYYLKYEYKKKFEEYRFTPEELSILDEAFRYFSSRIEFIKDKDEIISNIFMFDIDLSLPVINLNSPLSKRLSEILKMSMKNFVISHELSHISLLISKEDYIKMGGDLQDIFTEELKCDTLGARLGIQTTSKILRNIFPEFPWSIFSNTGSLFYLLCLEYYEKFSYILNNGTKAPEVLYSIDYIDERNNIYNSYPTAIFRNHFLTNILLFELERASANANEEINSMFEAFRLVDSYFKNSWVQIENEALKSGEFYTNLIRTKTKM